MTQLLETLKRYLKERGETFYDSDMYSCPTILNGGHLTIIHHDGDEIIVHPMCHALAVIYTQLKGRGYFVKLSAMRDTGHPIIINRAGSSTILLSVDNEIIVNYHLHEPIFSQHDPGIIKWQWVSHNVAFLKSDPELIAKVLECAARYWSKPSRQSLIKSGS